MKKTTVRVFAFTSLTMGWAGNVYALNFGENNQMGIKLFLALVGCHIIFLFVASKIVGIEVPDFWRAVSCSLGIAAILFLTLVITGNGNLQAVGLIIVGVAAIVLIQRVYNTTLGKTLGAFALSAIATFIAAQVLSGVL